MEQKWSEQAVLQLYWQGSSGESTDRGSSGESTDHDSIASALRDLAATGCASLTRMEQQYSNDTQAMLA